MVWYVGIVAVLNLCLGYGLAVYLKGRKQPATSPDGFDASSDSSPANQHVNRQLEEWDTAKAAESCDETPANGSSAVTQSPVPADALIAQHTDPATGLTTRDHVQQRLAEMTLTNAELQPATVALVEVEQTIQDGGEFDDRLLHGVANTVRDILAEVQLAGRYADRQFLLLLPQDDLRHATQRAEQVRQRIAATQYVADGREFQTTVTCALAQVADGHTAGSLLEFLEETLEEAKRYGGNRTFMHDGTAPTPVVPPELNIAPQTCAI